MEDLVSGQPSAVELGLGQVLEPNQLIRPTVNGKFLFVGREKFYVRGVTYGPFAPCDPGGCQYHDLQTVARDFAEMARHGINTVRTYTVPPHWLLDLALDYGLRVMLGLPWEQHIAFLDDRRTARGIERRLRDAVRGCRAHPAILCYAIGNEIPSHIARWYGRRRIEHFLHRLVITCKHEDPRGLFTYANYPSTEYLDLPFADIVSFNVYLETQARLWAYLARLQNLAGDRPLLVSELGLDSRRHGVDAQARAIDWQLRTVFSEGACGAVVFAWTDEWHRGGEEVTEWDFGLTTHHRQPKPALLAMSSALSETPFPPQIDWPRISVAVCTYNGSATLGRCLRAVEQLDYPNFETMVVDDGSTDDSSKIAAQSGATVIRTDNHGLSAARNTAMRAAGGEIIAYLDDDAYPDAHWLKYLALTFLRTQHAGVGGPNVAPSHSSLCAECVAHAPGGPSHVLLTDTLAEHIPGCNMAFRKAALEEIGGFDPQFRIAGDDVDLCWRLQDRGMSLGCNPAAMVWHHRRPTVRAYWKQQLNYGRAEAMLERKWPAKYNALGNPTWSGRLYGKGLLQALGCGPPRIYHGSWGSALFQSVYHTSPTIWQALPTTPEWYLILGLLALVTCGGAIWTPLLLAVPLFLSAAGLTIAQAAVASIAAFPRARFRTRRQLWVRRGLTFWLHLIQPAARLAGRISTGLTPWRRRGSGQFTSPWARRFKLWSTTEWRSLDHRIAQIDTDLRRSDAVVLRGGDFDNWDLEVRGGIFGSARLRMTVEEHGSNQQLVRLRAWPRCSTFGGLLALIFILICDAAAAGNAWSIWAIAGIIGLLLLAMILREIGLAMAAITHVMTGWEKSS